jgi:pectate lyase
VSAHRCRAALPALCLAALACALLPQAAGAAPAGHHPAHHRAAERGVLAPGDGWGSATTGTTGGSAADSAHVLTVHDRDGLAAAVAGDTPKIVRVKGTIDLAEGSTCADYAQDGYTLDGYLAAYDPAVWGRDRVPEGPLEDARDASAAAQAAQIQVPVGANTTIVGLGDDARILGGGLLLKNVDNVIVRDLTFEDAADCFPQWDPTDGDTGNWNSAYDNLSLAGATHVWVDHSTFTDGRNPDSSQPLRFGRPYQVHDGLFDITNASDLVTASWNVLKDHDKTMLIGSSDSSTADPGHLRVTLHHNLFSDVGQRAPRVRFGQVDAFDNTYRETASGAGEYVYSWGVGVHSQLVAENNWLQLGRVSPAAVLFNWGGTEVTVRGNVVNGARMDLLKAYNAANPATALGGDAGWTPVLRKGFEPAARAASRVAHEAGSGR